MDTVAPKSRENFFVLVMSLAAGLVFLDRYGIAFAFPNLHTELGLSNAQLGALMSATAIGWAVSSIVCSWASDRLGGRARPIVVGCMVLFSLATGLTGVATSFRSLLLIRALLGVLEGPVIPLMTAWAVAASSPHRRGANLGIVIAGVSLIGGALPPFLMTGLIQAAGWRHTFVLLAAPGLVLACLLALAMRRGGQAPSPQTPAPQAPRRQRGAITVAAVLRLLATHNMLLAILGGMFSLCLGITFASFAPSFLLAPGGLPSGTASLVLTLYGLLGAAGTVIGPALSDRVGRKPILLAGAALSLALPVGFALFRDNLPVLLAFLPLQLLAGGTLTLIVYVIPGELVPAELTATVFAVILAVGEMVGGSLGPWVAGLLSDRYGLVASMWFCAGVALLLLLTAALLRIGAWLPMRPATLAPPRIQGAGALD